MNLLKKENFFLLLLIILLFLTIFEKRKLDRMLEEVMGMPLTGKVVILDAGHGGRDVGKEGSYGMHEAEINLLITKKLQNYLEASGAYVILTRVDENGLYIESAKNKKAYDLSQRVHIMNDLHGMIAVSIHQNSFTDSKYKGSQVFYQKSSAEGKLLAESILSEMKKILVQSNNRAVKDADYYILNKSLVPTVLVECGFMSNAEEERLLNDEKYQEEIAFSIYSGISKYFDSKLER